MVPSGATEAPLGFPAKTHLSRARRYEAMKSVLPSTFFVYSPLTPAINSARLTMRVPPISLYANKKRDALIEA